MRSPTQQARRELLPSRACPETEQAVKTDFRFEWLHTVTALRHARGSMPMMVAEDLPASEDPGFRPWAGCGGASDYGEAARSGKEGGNLRAIQGCHPKFDAVREEATATRSTRLSHDRSTPPRGCNIMGQCTSRRHTAAGQVSPYADKHNERLLSTQSGHSPRRQRSAFLGSSGQLGGREIVS